MKTRYKKIFFTCVLAFVGFIAGILGYQDSFITDLSETASLSQTTDILPASPYRGTFTASHDRLGMVKLRMTTGGRINTNTIMFRLREVGSPDWLVENTYVTDRFVDGARYPFGFPVMENAKGKTYEYELAALDGSGENTVGVVAGPYSFQAEYIYSKNVIMSSPEAVLDFLKEKAEELFGGAPHIGYWIMCLLPVLFVTDLYIAASLLMIVLYGFLPVDIHSNMTLWIGASIFFCTLYKKNRTFSFLLSLIILALCALAYLFGGYAPAAKLATILPLLLLGGAIMTLIRQK